MNETFLENMRMTLNFMVESMNKADDVGEGDMRAAWLGTARTMSQMANSFAMASIAESMTQVASRIDCLAGIEESLNDIVGSVVKPDLLLPADDGGEDGPGGEGGE